MKKLLITFTLFIIGYTAIAQPGPPLCNDFVTVNGHDFKCGNELFYPVATVYTFRIGYNTIGAPLSDYFLMRCNSYGPCDNVNHYCAYESNTAIDCAAEIASDLGFIHQMGFNTIRTHELGAFFYTPNWFPNHNPIDLNNILIPTVFIPAANNATFGYGLELTNNQQGIDNRQRAFELIKEMLTQAHANSLKVLLDVGYSDVSDDFRNGSAYNNIDTYCTYLTQLASYIETLPLALRQTLIAYIIIEEPIYSNQTGNPKAAICDKTKQMYDAIKTGDTLHLISLGGDDLYDLMEWDPGVMKLDFWCPHFYPVANRDIEMNSDLAVERVLSQIYWLKNNCPMPWHIGETGFSATDDEVGISGINGWAPGHYSYPAVDGEIDATSFPNPTNAVYNQENYAQTILKYVRDCKGNGLTWWQYQELWNTATFSAMIGNNYSLLRHGTVDTTTLPTLKKPLVTEFENYLNTAGQPPAIDALGGQMPAHYYNPYNLGNGTTFNPSETNAVTGTILDAATGLPIQDAYILGWNWLKTIFHPNPMPGFYEYQYSVLYTYSDINGSFKLVPYNYLNPPISHPDRIPHLKISALGAERFDAGPWGDTPINSIFPNVDLDRSTLPFDATVNNVNVWSGMQNFKGWNSLTASNLYIATGASSDLTARSEIKINTEFDAEFGSEVHIYATETFPDCMDYSDPNFNRIASSTITNDQSEQVSIEVNFQPKSPFVYLEVKPNPNNGFFSIEVNSNSVIKSVLNINVYNVFGSLVYQDTKTETSFNLDFSAFAKGIYYLSISDQYNLLNQKIIIN